MDMAHFRVSLTILFALLLVHAGLAAAQTTGTITGVVRDPSGAVLPGATIEVVNEQTGDVRRAVSNAEGIFNVTPVPQGRYTLRVSLSQFATIEQRGIQLRTSEILNAGTIVLKIADVSEQVTVSATNLAAAQTATAVRTSVLEAKQLDTLVARGRDPMSLLNLLPGAVPIFGTTILGGTTGTNAPTISGQPGNSFQMSVNGMPSNDGDLTASNNSAVSMDAIEEIRVVLNGFAAEFGRNAGVQVNIVPKSGTQQYRGSLATYIRHDAMNSNTVQNQRSGLPKPYYRYYTVTGTFGGPVALPRSGKLSSTFFFYAREMWDTKLPANIQNRTMPTELERNGDFSSTTQPNGSPFFIADPLRVQQGLACSATTGGPGCFPGNVIPADRISALGRALVTHMPLPNFLDRTVSQGNYNYTDQDIGHRTATLDQVTVDHRLGAAQNLRGQFRSWRPNRKAYTMVFGDTSNFNHFKGQYAQSETSIQVGYTRTFKSRWANEATFAFRRTPEGGPVETNPDPISKLQRDPLGLSALGSLYTGARLNPYDLMPQVNYGGGIQNSPMISFDQRLPIDAGDNRYNLINNLTWDKGQHLVKLGFFFESNYNSEGDAGNCFSGCLNFAGSGGSAAQNPNNTNHPFANALLGYYTEYSESSLRQTAGARNQFIEWFAQDSWKAKPNLTLELGVRFAYGQTFRLLEGEHGSGYNGAALVAGRNPSLYVPACPPPQTKCATAARLAMNPVTGQILPNSNALIGQLVPGTGDFYNGLVQENHTLAYDGQFTQTLPVQTQPRLGFAWDPRGDGKMSIRGNYGITMQLQENSGQFAFQFPLAPPVRLQPTLYYGRLEDIGVVGSHVFAPQTVQGFADERKSRTTHNFAIEFQRDIGFKTLATIAYVGNRQRNLPTTRNINAVPTGARFQPSAIDPTSTTNAVLTDAFLRPIPQFANVNLQTREGYGDYNAMQFTATRRFSDGLAFGFNYALSVNKDLGGVVLFPDAFGDSRSRYYDYANADRRHIGSLNATFDVPGIGPDGGSGFTRALLNDWQLAGVWFFQSGAPSGITYTTTDAGGADTMGGGDPVRITIAPGCDPALSGSEQTEERWFNTSCFVRTARGNIGNAPRQVIRQPGRQNVDLTLSKSFSLKGRQRLQIRAEAYNAFKLTTRDADTTAQFDAAGNQIDTNFGRLELPQSEARVIQLSLRYQF
jgi:hypothetical protein